jgi:hypothetical protein
VHAFLHASSQLTYLLLLLLLLLTMLYLQLAKTLGVVKLIVVVNKLDDHSVAEDGKWSQAWCGF